MNEIGANEVQKKEASPYKIIKIGTTAVNIGHSLSETIKIIQEMNVEKIPIRILTNQSDKNLRLPLFFRKPGASFLGEFDAIFIEKHKGKEIKHKEKGGNSTVIHPIGFYVAVAKERLKDKSIRISGIEIDTNQKRAKIENEFKKINNNIIPENLIFE
jgi:hypothetical protein